MACIVFFLFANGMQRYCAIDQSFLSICKHIVFCLFSFWDFFAGWITIQSIQMFFLFAMVCSSMYVCVCVSVCSSFFSQDLLDIFVFFIIPIPLHSWSCSFNRTFHPKTQLSQFQNVNEKDRNRIVLSKATECWRKRRDTTWKRAEWKSNEKYVRI